MEHVLYQFAGKSGDGLEPTGGLTIDSDGNLYGVTLEGGAFSSGTVFELSPPTQGSSWTETVLYSFGSFLGDSTYPDSSLTLDSAGNLYGVSEYGGLDTCGSVYHGCGTVFEVSPPSAQGNPWNGQVLHSFAGGTDGADVQSAPTIAGPALFGVTIEGGRGVCSNQNGTSGCGTIFEIGQQ